MRKSVFPGIPAVLAALAVFGFVAAAVSQIAPAPPAAGPAVAARLLALGKRDIHVHDPSSIVQCKGDYWIFYTGRGTPSYHSKDLTRWERGPVTFTAPPAWVAQAVPGNSGLDFWAPDIIQVGNRYLLYYAVSSFGKNVSAIGLATNPTLAPADPRYHWTDQGLVVRSDRADDFNALDPAVTLDAGGKLWLSFGSFWSGIKLVQLDPATGKRISPDSQLYSLAHYDTIEAPYIYYHRGYYYLFVNWGFCCRGVRSDYSIHMGRSKTITGPYRDKDGTDLLAGGGSLFLTSNGPFIGPGHTSILAVGNQYVMSCHFYDASQGGRSAFAVRPLIWAADGWPVVGEWPVAGEWPQAPS